MHNKWRWLALAAIVAVVHFWGRMIEERVFEVVWPVVGPVLFYSTAAAHTIAMALWVFGVVGFLVYAVYLAGRGLLRLLARERGAAGGDGQ